MDSDGRAPCMMRRPHRLRRDILTPAGMGTAHGSPPQGGVTWSANTTTLSPQAVTVLALVERTAS